MPFAFFVLVPEYRRRIVRLLVTTALVMSIALLPLNALSHMARAADPWSRDWVDRPGHGDPSSRPDLGAFDEFLKKCGPWHPGGYNPVPPRPRSNSSRTAR